MDKIARLGRLGYTISTVESAANSAIRKRQLAPRLGGIPAFEPPNHAQAVFANSVGYVQQIHVNTIQERAHLSQLKVLVAALPGTFGTPFRPIAWVIAEKSQGTEGNGVTLFPHAGRVAWMKCGDWAISSFWVRGASEPNLHWLPAFAHLECRGGSSNSCLTMIVVAWWTCART